MARVREGRLRKAWNDMREAGGSIISHKGENLTGRTYDGSTFIKYVNELCASDVAFVDGVLERIDMAIREGNNIALLNEASATKCYSKPIVKLAIGCEVSFELVARNGLEEDCADGR